jgi:hypothetical protein
MGILLKRHGEVAGASKLARLGIFIQRAEANQRPGPCGRLNAAPRVVVLNGKSAGPDNANGPGRHMDRSRC